MKTIAQFAGIALILTSCASTPPICKPDNATQAGIALALRGAEYNEAEGAVCEDEDRNVFRTAFMKGYQEGKARLCDANGMEQSAFAVGRDGKVNDYASRPLNLCENKLELSRVYKVGYGKGLKEFCVTENAAIDAEKEGDGGLEASVVSQRYTLCSAAQQKAISKVYKDAYERGINRFCEEGRVLRIANDQARNSPDPAFPEDLAVCFKRSDNLRENFVHAFNEERKRFVRENCTFERGRTDGNHDAGRMSSKRGAVPIFCDNATFGVYFSGYSEGWSNTKRSLCSTAAAFNEGYEEGNNEQMEFYSAPSGCEEMSNELRQHYLNGYRQGKLQASLRKNLKQEGRPTYILPKNYPNN